MESSAAAECSTSDRTDLQLHAQASPRQHQELGAFLRFCVFRIERELGASQRWTVKVDPAAGGFQSTIVVRDGASDLHSTGRGLDGALAVWHALCCLEQTLREARSRRRSRRTSAESFDRG